MGQALACSTHITEPIFQQPIPVISAIIAAGADRVGGNFNTEFSAATDKITFTQHLLWRLIDRR